MTKRASAFTIVELLIVIVVIAILAAISIVAYRGIQERAASVTLQSDLRNAATQLGIDKANNGTYPSSITAANEGKGLSKSAGVSFQYTTTGDTFCLTAVSDRGGVSAYNVSSSSALAQGACSGHNSTSSVALNCPTNFIIVPGNSTFGTSDFCVMKYEARNAGSNVPVSIPTGTPWVNISQVNAISYSSNVAGCSGCHLMTEPEWMTIAANVTSVASNWTSGTVGSGSIYTGHNDANPNRSIAASSDDTDGYIGTGNTSGGQRRTLTLTNGEVIWDFSGNLWEWTTLTIPGGQMPGLSGDSVKTVKQWNNSSIVWGAFPSSSRPNAADPSYNSYTSSNGIGQLYSNRNDPSTYGMFRGGNFNNPGLSGVFAGSLERDPTYAGTNVGFRVAK